MLSILQIMMKMTTMIPFNREPKIIFFLRSSYTYLFLLISIVCCSKFALESTQISERCIAFTFAISSLNAIVKITVKKANRSNVYGVIEKLIKKETKEGFAGVTRKLARHYFTMIMIVVLTWNVYPLFSNQMKTTIPIWLPFEIKDRLTYMTSYIFVFGIFFYQSTIHTATECVVMLAVAEISTTIDFLKEQAKDFGDKVKMYKTDSEDQEDMEESIIYFFKRHIEIMQLTKMLTSITEVIFLVQVVQSILMSCTFAYAVSKMTTPEEVIRFMPTILTILWQLFIFCYYGQILKDKLEGIHYYLFWKDWSFTPIAVQKSILINLSYTSRTVKFNQHLVYPMSIITFVEAIRQSLSFYMFLRTVAKN